ncbi:hypothetical protein ARSEF4850_007557, partial [Beauveria asiatica]
MRERTHHGGAAKTFLFAAALGSGPDDDSSSVQSSSTENMADAVVPGPEGNNRYGSETEGEGGSQHEEDSLDDDETRSADSDSAGSLADFVAPDWEILGGEEDEAVGDDDYEDEGSADEDEEEGDEGAAGDDDGDDDSPNRAYLPSRDAISRLEIIAAPPVVLLQAAWEASELGAPTAPTRWQRTGGVASQRGVGRVVATFAQLEAGTPPDKGPP